MDDRTAPVAVFLGDSITAGGSWQDWLPDLEVVNLAVGGYTTDDMLEQVQGVVERAPDWIVLMIGTNDLGTRKPVEHLVRNIEYALMTLRREIPGVRILVQSILPRGHEFADQIRDANRHLWQFSATIHAQWLDLWPAFALEDGELNPVYSDDRLHLNDEGYTAWLAELRPALERLREAPPLTTPIQVIRDA